MTAASVVERCRRWEGGGLRTFVDPEPLAWERAEGCHVWDADGRRYLDLYGGFAVAATGHGHPRVVEAIRRQAGDLLHCPSAHPSRVRAEFLEALAAIAPVGLTKFLPCITGAMANEIAIALARTRNGGDIVTFAGGYFGRSVGTVGYAGKARYRQALGVPAQAQFVPFPYPLRHGPKATDIAMTALESLAHGAGGGGKIAAVLLEPIQGNGGVVIPPADFLPRLRHFCDRIGAWLIVDEIQSGCGRTGRMWAMDHAGVTPDLMTVGKGIGGGMAVAAVLGRPELMTWKADSYTSTFLTNNLNLAAATAAMTVLREEKLAERAAALAPAAAALFRQRLGNMPGIAELRHLGLWFAVELADAEWAARAARRCRERGLIVGRGGYDDSVIKLSPPLVIEESVLSEEIAAVAQAIIETREP